MKFKLKTKLNRASIWGEEDKATLRVLNKTKIKGKWLNLAAGDGRYNSILLKKANFVVASDKNKNDLKILLANTPRKYKSKLEIKVFDLTKKFPYKDNSFDGVFCTGTLHLFPRKILVKILKEIDRVLKSKGKIIIDFATDINRITSTGKFVKMGNEPLYTLKVAKQILDKSFKNYNLKIIQSEVRPQIIKARIPYKFSCKFLILSADKNKC